MSATILNHYTYESMSPYLNALDFFLPQVNQLKDVRSIILEIFIRSDVRKLIIYIKKFKKRDF